MDVLTHFMAYAGRAKGITCDDGQIIMLEDQELMAPVGNPDNIVLRLQWHEGSYSCGHEFTEEAISTAVMDTEGKFVVRNRHGELVVIRFYEVKRLVPGDARDKAEQFFAELLESCETLTQIAELHDATVLANLMYLQQAILKGTFIELTASEMAVRDIVATLPSAACWRAYIKEA
ncbi:hypothetical protein [Gulbenkiania mobilis]|uniref:hypothetical protein n=1 Tax=Gulbenkiania mobilis TaxID=397457 RepID=UPI0006BBE949|nr:hypothetical protein [Gulbenkiania mobilis]